MSSPSLLSSPSFVARVVSAAASLVAAFRRTDPRWFQIGTLATLVTLGLTVLGFDLGVAQVAVTITAVLGTQALCSRIKGIPYDAKSALISGLGLCLLLRTNHLWLVALAAFIAVASKFVIRFRGKHVFNPTNGAIVLLLAIGAPIWVSPGQWGNVALFGFLMGAVGTMVVTRAARWDTALFFIAFWAFALFYRSNFVNEPWTIPIHRLQSGGLILFTFFMITDPKTTPNSRLGRAIFCALVAYGAYYVQFKMFRTNGVLWSLAVFSMIVPLIDLILPGDKYDWRDRIVSKVKLGVAKPLAAMAILFALFGATGADAFCGFYVAKADAKMFNQASQVVIVRDEDKTVLTMANDFQGKVKDFAMVIPVPTKLEREQIHIGDMKVVDHVDAYTVPRLVEYFDPDPCEIPRPPASVRRESRARSVEKSDAPDEKPKERLGVKIEASYTVGEYDILILSAQQSDGLVQWLKEEGYKIPTGAEPVIDSYLKQKMKWFVAKVNLNEHDKLGGGKLRPIQVAYESPKFMLPIRLGTVNANGTQDLFAYVFTKKGRVEVTNYKTVKLPTDKDVPEYVKDEFQPFYKALFSKTVKDNDMRAVVTEYAWNLSINCDPCSADPIIPQLKSLGVWWVDNIDDYHSYSGGVGFVTRLHVRYDRDHFPEDLVFQQTSDTTNFQGRYVIRHPFKGQMTCEKAAPYLAAVWERQQQEAKNVAELTGVSVGDVKTKMNLSDTPPKGAKGNKWYEKLWK